MKNSKLQSKTQNWEVKRLNEVCEVNPNAILNQSDGTVEYVEMAVIDENLKEIKYFLDRPINKVSSGTPKFMNNDVIFARITPCTENGKVAFVENCDGVCAGSTELHVLRAKQEVLLPRFLFYLLIRPEIKDMAVASMSGTTGRQRVPAEFFHYLKIPIPPLSIQHQIVERLDAIRKAQELNDKQIALADELFQSLLHRELDPKGKNWEVKRLGEVSDFAKGATKKFLEGNSEALMLRIMDFNWGSFTKNPGIKISFDPAKKQFILSENEILFDPVNGSEEQIGKSVFVGHLSPFNEIVVAESNLIRIRTNKDLVHPQFLSAFLISRYGKIGLKKITSKTSAGQYLIKLTLLRSLEIPIPPLESQRQIVQKLQAVQDYKKSLLAQKQKLKELFESTLDKATTPQSHFAPTGQEGELGRF